MCVFPKQDLYFSFSLYISSSFILFSLSAIKISPYCYLHIKDTAYQCCMVSHAIHPAVILHPPSDGYLACFGFPITTFLHDLWRTSLGYTPRKFMAWSWVCSIKSVVPDFFPEWLHYLTHLSTAHDPHLHLVTSAF